jgi:hypothetical protein
MAFQGNAIDKLKKNDKLQKTDPDKEESGKNKDQVRCCAISETQTVCCSPVI